MDSKIDIIEQKKMKLIDVMSSRYNDLGVEN